MRKLSERAKRFCEEWLIDCNATRAAKAAGYSRRTARAIGQKLLTKVDIQKHLSKLMAEKNKALVASQDEILEYLTAVMRRQLKECVVVVVKETTYTREPDESGKLKSCKHVSEVPRLIEIPAKLSDANRAAELLGKRYGLFTEKIDVGGTLPVIIMGEDAIAD